MCIANPVRSSGVEQAIAGVFAPRRAEVPAESARRRKLWDMRQVYHCPVIGTCLSVEELRGLARRSGVEGWQAASDYELHSIAVGLARERNDFSQALQKTLDRKFEAVLRRFNQAGDEDAVAALWQAALHRGEPAGAFWALLSHPKVSEKVAHPAYEDIHMLSHQVGATSRADLRELARLKADNAELEERLARQRRHHAEQLAAKDDTIARLEAALCEARAASQATPVVLSGTPEDAVQAALEHAERRAREALARLAEAQNACAELEAERDAAESALNGLLTREHCGACPEGQAGRCTGADFAGRCVLCVGGRSGLANQYRSLVESRNGRFVHHDGGLEDSPKRLSALLSAADAVICPADNVSHGAYYLVKRLCKQYRKPCVLLKRSGLSTFAKGLAELAEEEGHIQG